MDTADRNSKKAIRIVIAILILVLLAGLFGWQMGKSDTKDSPTSSSSAPMTGNSPSSEQGVKSLVSYTLPDGWREEACPANADKVYAVPAGETLKCNTSPVAPVSITKDNGNTTDCNQINAPEGVKKHTCKSLFINGMKSLRAETEFAEGNTSEIFYVDSGDTVIKVEYAYSGEDKYSQGFEALANSMKAK